MWCSDGFPYITCFSPSSFSSDVSNDQMDAKKHKIHAFTVKSGLIIQSLIWMLMFCLFSRYIWLLTEADVLFEALHNTRRRSGRHAFETHMMLTGIPSRRETDRLAHHRHARWTQGTWKYQTPIRSSVRASRNVRKVVCDLGIVYNVTELVRWPITTRVRKICEAACVAIVGEALMARRPPSAGRSCIAARSAQPHSRAHDLGIELGNGPARRGGRQRLAPRGEAQARGPPDAPAAAPPLSRHPSVIDCPALHTAITLFSFNFSTPMGGYPDVCTFFAIYVLREAIVNSSIFFTSFILPLVCT